MLVEAGLCGFSQSVHCSSNSEAQYLDIMNPFNTILNTKSQYREHIAKALESTQSRDMSLIEGLWMRCIWPFASMYWRDHVEKDSYVKLLFCAVGLPFD